MTNSIHMAAAVLLLTAGAAQAQVAQSSVIGTTGDPVYTTLVQGADGNQYECRPDVVNRNGQLIRECRRRRAVGANPSGGGQLGGGLLGLLGLGLAALAVGSSSSSTN